MTLYAYMWLRVALAGSGNAVASAIDALAVPKIAVTVVYLA
jgi:hypothetical protein